MHRQRRTVLITGCSSGIGLAAAERMRARGWRVFAGARQAADLERLASSGFEALRLELDDPASIRLGLAHLMAATGGTLDALVSNAAYGQPGAVEDLSREALRRQFETNLFGTMDLANLVIPAMRAQGHGRLVFISSILGLVPMPLRGAYNASKFALEGLVGTLRLELHGSGIAVSIVNPGAIESRFREHAVAAVEREVDVERSVHAARYARLRRLNERAGGRAPGSLPASAVADKIEHALESRWPYRHYHVTLAAHALALLRRVLPVAVMDRLLARI